jgi:NTP pyrophosphatase (non-canonical NTP hydrolase)
MIKRPEQLELFPKCTLQAEKHVVQWAKDKGIITPWNQKTQMKKMIEEVFELQEAVVEGDKQHVRLELGDVLVTCVVQASMWGMSLDECLTAAFNKINSRTGKLVDGVFVKEEDL